MPSETGSTTCPPRFDCVVAHGIPPGRSCAENLLCSSPETSGTPAGRGLQHGQVDTSAYTGDRPGCDSRQVSEACGTMLIETTNDVPGCRLRAPGRAEHG